MKSLKVRLEECCEIKKQLESLGIFVLPENKMTTTEKMNRYIRDGSCETFVLLADGHKFQIVLTSSENKQSGITMIPKS
jgi:hypothetical protein